jgi:hypothetical protein
VNFLLQHRQATAFARLLAPDGLRTAIKKENQIIREADTTIFNSQF